MTVEIQSSETAHSRLALGFYAIAIFHPLIGFSLVSVSSALVHRVGRILFPNLANS